MDPSLHRVAQTKPFSSAVAGTTVLFSPDSDKTFVVTKWYFTSAGAQTILFDSKPTGAETNLTGALDFPAAGSLSDGSGDEAVLIGNANGDDLRITTSQAVQTDGYVVVAQKQE